MTPSPSPDTTVDPTPRPAVVSPPGGGLGVTIAERFAGPVERAELCAAITGAGLWYLARCHRCALDNGVDNGVPFRDETERDVWAAGHVTATGHVVHLSIDGLAELPDLHLVGVISRDPNLQFRFVCPAVICGTSNGPYDTAESAIASWRQHTAPQPAGKRVRP